MSISTKNASTEDLAIGRSLTDRRIYSQSPERLVSSPASLDGGAENVRSKGRQGDVIRDADFDDEREAAGELRLRARRPRRTRRSSEVDREEFAASSTDGVAAQDKCRNADAASEDDLERRPRDGDRQPYFNPRASNHDDDFEGAARSRGTVPGQDAYWDIAVSETGRPRNTRNESFEQRERRFEHLPRGDEPQYGDRHWLEEEDIPNLGNRRGQRRRSPYMEYNPFAPRASEEDIPNLRNRRGERRRSTYKEYNPFEPRTRSEERVRPNVRSYNRYDSLDKRGRDQFLSPSNVHRVEVDEGLARPQYMPPTGKAGESLKIDIESSPATKDEQTPPYIRRPLTSEIPSKQSLSFEASCGTTNDSGMENVYLTQKSPNDPLGASNLRWIHKQESCISIEGFQAFLKDAGLSQSDLLLTLRLLHQVAARAEKELNHSYILDPLVIRGDAVQGPDEQNQDFTTQNPAVNTKGVPGPFDPNQRIAGQRSSAPERHCTFINFPYLSLQPLETSKAKNLKYHHPRGLLQTLYRLESTASREKEQAICKDRKSSDKSICVPQLWSIIVGSDILITYSPHFLSDLTRQNVLIKKPLAAARPNPSILRVTDMFQKTLFFSLDQCRSWLEFQELVYSQFEYSHYTHNLLHEHGIILNALMWQRMIKASEKPVINLSIETKEIHYPRYRDSDGSDTSADFAFMKAQDGQAYLAQDRYERLGRRKRVEAASRLAYEEAAYDNLNNANLGKDHWSIGRRGTYSPSRDNNDKLVATGRQPERLYRTAQITHARNNIYDQDNVIAPYSNETVTGQRLTETPLFLREAEPVPKRSAYAAAYLPRTLQRSATMDTDVYRNRKTSYYPPVERRNEYSAVEPNYRLYNAARRPPAPDGIINNRIQDENETNMYFVPIVEQRVPRRVETSSTAGARAYERIQMQTHPTRRAFLTVPNGSDEHVTIPIFLWPTGIPDSTEKKKDWAGMWDAVTETKTTKSINATTSRDSPPRRASTQRLSHVDTASLSLVLESVIESFTDSSQPSKLFHSMPNSDAKDCFPGRDLLTAFHPHQQMGPAGDAITSEAVTNQNNSLQDDDILTTDPSAQSTHRIDRKRRQDEENISLRNFRVEERLRIEQRLRDMIAAQNDEILRRPAVPQPPFVVRDLPSSDESSSGEADASDEQEVLPNKIGMEGQLSAELDDELKAETDRKTSGEDRNPPSFDDTVPKDTTQQHHTSEDVERHVNPSIAAEEREQLILARERDELLINFFNVSQALLYKFVPRTNTSVVTMKYFGTIKRCVGLVRSLHDDCLLKSKTKSTDVWIIDDVNMIVHKYYQTLPRPSRTLENCEKCRSRTAYKSEAEASQHLSKVHFQNVEIARDQARLWIKQESQHVEKKEQYQHALAIFRNCTRILHKAAGKLELIQESVFTSEDELRSCYRLPNTIVESFCSILKVLLWTSSVLSRASKNINSQSRNMMVINEISEASIHLRSLGRKLLSELEDGENDLMEMVRLQQSLRGIKKVQEIGPQYVLAMVLSNLQLGVNCEDLIDVYERYIERLSFQANQFPRRRLIRSFIYLDEETKIIYETVTRQSNLLTDFWQVIDPSSFETTTESRVSMFELENELIKKTQRIMDVKRADLLEMEFQIDRLIQQTKTSLEIKDDDHGKAILVFTIVTLIFLPLSFVSSFFGMNTADIRDMNSSQTIFWAVAIPITVGVMFLALAIGYKFDAIREWFEKMMGKSKMD